MNKKQNFPHFYVFSQSSDWLIIISIKKCYGELLTYVINKLEFLGFKDMTSKDC